MLRFSENCSPTEMFVEGKTRTVFFPTNTLIYGICRDGSTNYDIRTCEHMILSQLQMGASQTNFAPLNTSTNTERNTNMYENTNSTTITNGCRPRPHSLASHHTVASTWSSQIQVENTQTNTNTNTHENTNARTNTDGYRHLASHYT